MVETKYEELKEFFLPFVMERYKGTAVSFDLRTCLEYLAKAFLWCILKAPDEMHLNEITTVTKAEAFYERGLYTLLNNLQIGTQTIKMEEMLLMLPVEIHNWLLFLQHNGKLPGAYDRFTGLYKSVKD